MLMIGKLVYFFKAKWKSFKIERKMRKLEKIPPIPLNIQDEGISFGYIRAGESVHDLQ